MLSFKEGFDTFEARRRNFELCRDKEFTSHVCAEHPREPNPTPDATASEQN
jgi:hypothetical protein